MAEKVKIKASKVAPAGVAQGYFRWFIEYTDDKRIDKYNSKAEKNVYESGGKVNVKVADAAVIGLTDPKGNVVASLAVPAGAKVFQRRRGYEGDGGINYNNQFRTAVYTVPETMMALVDGGKLGMVWKPCNYDSELGQYVAPLGTKQTKVYPEKRVVKDVPVWKYREMWLVGYRLREKDDSVTVKYLAVYPDGKVDEHTAWKEKPWLREPQWFPDEQV